MVFSTLKIKTLRIQGSMFMYGPNWAEDWKTEQMYNFEAATGSTDRYFNELLW